MNQLTKKAIFHPKFHSRAWFPDLRWEAPNFTHWFLGRMGWGTSLGLHADPAQFQDVGVTTAPPTSTAPLPLLTYRLSTRPGRACRLTMAGMTSRNVIGNKQGSQGKIGGEQGLLSPLSFTLHTGSHVVLFHFSLILSVYMRKMTALWLCQDSSELARTARQAPRKPTALNPLPRQ